MNKSLNRQESTMNNLVVKKVSGAESPKFIVLVKISVWDLAYDFPVWDTDFVVLDIQDTKRVINKIEHSYKDLVDGIIKDYEEEGVKEAVKDIDLNIQGLLEEVEYNLLDDAFNGDNFNFGNDVAQVNAYTQYEVEVRRIGVI